MLDGWEVRSYTIIPSLCGNSGHGQVTPTNSATGANLVHFHWEVEMECLLHHLGMDYSHHIRINVSVIRGIIWDISAHSLHKGEVLFFSSVYIEMVIIKFEVKVDV